MGEAKESCGEKEQGVKWIEGSPRVSGRPMYEDACVAGEKRPDNEISGNADPL
jgi:hypothetical protein